MPKRLKRSCVENFGHSAVSRRYLSCDIHEIKVLAKRFCKISIIALNPDQASVCLASAHNSSEGIVGDLDASAAVIVDIDLVSHVAIILLRDGDRIGSNICS